ncbi:hypothetical protein BT63DRAFT_379220 [Microthyrium microscopicum]|uniref:Vps41 beta-propeller domain-containing protein n=1 Tax=Microthyrium microscopicum TaxID=703497 RepID=A0A6A6TVY6_9PEZI|nr:hypothetical protein BT63DRAFT_379220 [Microthyrium microscopicum]
MATEPHDDTPEESPRSPTRPTPSSPPITPSRTTTGGSKPIESSKKEVSETPRNHAPEDEDVSLEGEDEDDDSAEENDSADEEPRLKYHRLTGKLSSVYRNGDATSSFLVGGDKMIIGTHNGNIAILSMPTFQPLKIYNAHSASVTAVSVSPFPLPFSSLKTDFPRPLPNSDAPTSSPARENPDSKPAPSPATPRQNPIPASPSNAIYIATSSIDGHVCVANLVDYKDVTIRNFSRPVSAVALSQDYKNDRSYLSGGLAGNLILTVGGRSGVSAKANTNLASSAASGWLNSIGLGTNTGSDRIIHSGEGPISVIKWSHTGKFVVWVNEQGVKIMRTNSHLESGDSELAWNRIGHIDRPNRAKWEDMAGVWKARAEWIDDQSLETGDDEPSVTNGGHPETPARNALSALHSARQTPVVNKKKRSEKLVIGWGDTVWVVQVKAEHNAGRDNSKRTSGSASILHHLLFDDCIVSGVSLYTPSLLAVLAYRTRDDEDKPLPVMVQTTPRRGVHHRQTGLSPELRLIDVNSKEEVDVDTLTMSRYESLSAADYHLGTLFVPTVPIASTVQRSALEAFSGGLWDASISATRIFSSAASIRSGTGSGDNAFASPATRQGSLSKVPGASPSRNPSLEAVPLSATSGLKLFVQSPYDCVLALKRDLADHLQWLLEHEEYKEAWELVKDHPEVIATSSDDFSIEDGNGSASPLKRQSLVDFFADDSASQTTLSATKNQKRATENEARRIGDLWIQQLVAADDWANAGQTAGKVLGASPRWEHWVWKFAQAGRFNEITPYIPNKPTTPRIPSIVYERLLGHYIIRDRIRFKDLIDSWEPELFNIGHVTAAIEKRLGDGDASEDSIQDGVQGRDWRILLDALAKLYIADGRPKEALRCYIKLQNADAAMDLISEYHLVESIAEDVVGFLMLRVSRDQLVSANLAELEENITEAVRMLVEESIKGAIEPDKVVKQIQAKGNQYRPFLFFFFRALWKGHGTIDTKSHRFSSQRFQSEGRMAVEDFGDLAVALFADYDRTNLMDFLRQSRSYSYEQATALCEQKQYFPELVYLLSQTGQTKRALGLIISSLGDVRFAIEFAKEQEDAELWDDLLEFSMDKPGFIKGLLEEVGTAIDPIKLVRRIPEGLEIEGLRDGIRRMVREYEIQGSISEGVARVLRGEVAGGMEALRNGRQRGVKFDVLGEKEVATTDAKTTKGDQEIVTAKEEEQPSHRPPEPGHCVRCRKAFMVDDKDILIGFACGHIYHLSCIITTLDDELAIATAQSLQKQLVVSSADEEIGVTRSVGAKVAHAQMIKTIASKGCPHCRRVAVE